MVKWFWSLIAGMALTLGLLWMLTPRSNVEAASDVASGRLSPLLLPGGSTISGALMSSDTWGPGVITLTGDVLIYPGVTITIAPGTKVQIATSDGYNQGVDASRIEFIVGSGGALRANGPVTFTSKSGHRPAATGTASVS
jgi:hypothetical protein